VFPRGYPPRRGSRTPPTASPRDIVGLIWRSGINQRANILPGPGNAAGARRRSFYRRRKTIRIYIRAREERVCVSGLCWCCARATPESERERERERERDLSSVLFSRGPLLPPQHPRSSVPCLPPHRTARLSKEHMAWLIGAKAAPAQQLPLFCPPASADAPRRGPPRARISLSLSLSFSPCSMQLSSLKRPPRSPSVPDVSRANGESVP